jgi:TetR/AcrR family transcriptional repressor of nem operon
MKVTKAQSQENRSRIVETASALFREQGYDGVSVADLMAAAGLTHGGFYRHFGSKADLMAEAAGHGLDSKMREYTGVDMAGFVQSYLSREHRDSRGTGCTVAALAADAARQPEAVQARFATGIARMLAAVQQGAVAAGADETSARALAIGQLSQMVGALVLSRACPDDAPLADEILAVCRDESLAQLAPTAAKRPFRPRRQTG